MGQVFFPENFGARGNGITNDTISIQAAIDAASVSGGNVILSRDYAIGTAGKRDFQQYPDVSYALLIAADNVHLWGPGRLLLNHRPLVDGLSFTALAIGTGDGVLSNVGCHGIMIDASALTRDDLAAMGAASVGASIGVYMCRDFIVEHNIIKNGWGFTGALTVHVLSEYGTISHNKVYGSHQTGFWLDGLRHSSIINNWILNAGTNGVVFAVNNDNNRNGIGNTFSGNRVINWQGGGGVILTGVVGHQICNNVIESTGQPSSGLGLRLQGAGIYLAQDCIISNNRIQLTNTPKGQGIELVGSGGGICVDNVIVGNLVRGFSYAAKIFDNVQGNRVVGNVLDSYLSPSIVILGSIGISNNVFEPNY